MTPAVDEFEETLSFQKDVTGVDHTIFISAHAGNGALGPRVKVAIDPPDILDPRVNIATVTLDGAVIGEIDPQLLRQVLRFMQTNRQALLDYWLYRIDTDQLRQRLQSI